MSEEGNAEKSVRQETLKEGLNGFVSLWGEATASVRAGGQTDPQKQRIGKHLFTLFEQLPRHSSQLDHHYIERVKEQFGPTVLSDIPMKSLGIAPNRMGESGLGIFDEDNLHKTERQALQDEISLLSGIKIMDPEIFRNKRDFILRWIASYKEIYQDSSFDRTASRLSPS